MAEGLTQRSAKLLCKSLSLFVASKNMKPALWDLVEIKEDHPEMEIEEGDTGTIIHTEKGLCVVEYLDDDRHPDYITLGHHQVAVVVRED